MSEERRGPRNLTAAEWLDEYAARAGVSSEDVLRRRAVVTCDCDYKDCEGWGVTPSDCVLPWREQVALTLTETDRP